MQKTIQPVFTSHKFKEDLSLSEPKPNIITQPCVVYLFKCDLCDAGYVEYTKGHLHARVEGHRQKASSIYRHYCKEDNTAVPNNFLARFNVIKKCTNKFDCLVNEMLCIQKLKNREKSSSKQMKNKHLALSLYPSDLNNCIATGVDHRYHDMSNWIETSKKCRKKTSSKPFST